MHLAHLVSLQALELALAQERRQVLQRLELMSSACSWWLSQPVLLSCACSGWSLHQQVQQVLVQDHQVQALEQVQGRDQGQGQALVLGLDKVMVLVQDQAQAQVPIGMREMVETLMVGTTTLQIEQGCSPRAAAMAGAETPKPRIPSSARDISVNLDPIHLQLPMHQQHLLQDQQQQLLQLVLL